MVPLEAQACGRPVIAYGIGGSLETVRGAGPNPTGTYFTEQTPSSAADAITRWETQGEPHFNPLDARAWAATFATPIFLEHYRNFVLTHCPQAASAAAPLEYAINLVAPQSLIPNP
jgi:glycosyltransferase involved in cell wall biosynthesis